MSIYNPSGKQYLRCTKRLDNKSCAGCGKIITMELEAVVYQQMIKKLASYKTLTGRKKAAKTNPKIAALQVELAHVDSEIGYLDTWDSVSFDDKRQVVDLMITTIAATSDSLNITWKI